MSKYDPLAERLAGHRGDEWRASFAELEEVLGFPLPKAARSGTAWWSNNGDKRHTRAWRTPGWEVGEVDHTGGAVTFRRPVSEAELQDPLAHEIEPTMEVVPAVSARFKPALGPVKRRLGRWGLPAVIAAGATVAAGMGALLLRRARTQR